MRDPRAWSYAIVNIYSTKNYATGSAKMRYSDSMVVLTQSDVYDHIRKRLYILWE